MLSERYVKSAFYGDKIIPQVASLFQTFKGHQLSCTNHLPGASSFVVSRCHSDQLQCRRMHEVLKPPHLTVFNTIHWLFSIVKTCMCTYMYIQHLPSILLLIATNFCITSTCYTSLPCEKWTGNNLEIWQNQLASGNIELSLWQASGVDKMKGFNVTQHLCLGQYCQRYINY